MAGGVDGDLSPSAGGLIPGGVTVLKNSRGVVARIQGEPTVPGMIPGGIASRPIPGKVVRTWRGTGGSWYDSKWCSVLSNARKSSSNPGRETGDSWHDSRWCSVPSFLFIAGHLCL